MAKVFAVVEDTDSSVQLLSWPSAAAFLRSGESFLDDKFIYIATTDDYKKEGLFSAPMREEDKDFIVKTSEIKFKAHNIMNQAFVAHFKKN